MGAILELEKETSSTFSVTFNDANNELLKIRLILRAIHKCRRKVGRDGLVVIKASCGQCTRKRELGACGTYDEDEIADILELLHDIHQDVLSARIKKKEVIVVVSA